MNIHPLRISIYICIVLTAMFGLMYFSEAHPLEDGRSQDGFNLKSSILKYPTYSTFFGEETLSKERKQEIDEIMENIEVLVSTEQQKKEIPDYTKIDSTKIQRISYPPGQSTAFIEKLKSDLSSDDCKIIHYGDSQIEGDRISAYIRNRLQTMYGGSGPGFIPIKQVYHQISAEVTPSENWMRFAAFDPTQEKSESKNYGAYLSFSRFTDFPEHLTDSLDSKKTEPTRATIAISPSLRSYVKLRNITTVGLHYGNVTDSVAVKIYSEGSLIKESNLKEGPYQKLEINFPEGLNEMKLEFEAVTSPDFYGLTLNGDSGVSLDNVAMRGNSGTTFGSLNRESFDGMYREINPKIILMQYGGNTVPYLKDSTAVENYSRHIKGHINWIRRSAPEASFIFIGPSDMATMINGQITSYALLPYLDKKLKESCHENNVAYWSIFNAMGGKNSLKYWYDQGLMSGDYVHFTPAGTRIISELFFTALHIDLKNEK